MSRLFRHLLALALAEVDRCSGGVPTAGSFGWLMDLRLSRSFALLLQFAPIGKPVTTPIHKPSSLHYEFSCAYTKATRPEWNATPFLGRAAECADAHGSRTVLIPLERTVRRVSSPEDPGRSHRCHDNAQGNGVGEHSCQVMS